MMYVKSIEAADGVVWKFGDEDFGSVYCLVTGIRTRTRGRLPSGQVTQRWLALESGASGSKERRRLDHVEVGGGLKTEGGGKENGAKRGGSREHGRSLGAVSIGSDWHSLYPSCSSLLV
ncbi:hypothetical protein TNCV_604011 [Trichonephila clavipes]|nr:hypothetical protein TNCV_604011 [Trichonephila clavipes]